MPNERHPPRGPPRSEPLNTFTKDMNVAMEAIEEEQALSPNPSDQPAQRSPTKQPARRSLRQSYDAITRPTETFSHGHSPTIEALRDSAMTLRRSMLEQTDWIGKATIALDENQAQTEERFSDMDDRFSIIENRLNRLDELTDLVKSIQRCQGLTGPSKLYYI